VAYTIAKAVRNLRSAPDSEPKSAKVARLQALIAAKLTFRELLQVVVPMTVWWKDRQIKQELLRASANERLRATIPMILAFTKLRDDDDAEAPPFKYFTQLGALDRYVALAGVILWASKYGKSPDGIVKLE
jgi:hypothetical protein